MFRSGLPQPLSSQNVDLSKAGFDLTKAGATQTETPSFKHDAGQRVDLLGDYDVPARTIRESSGTLPRQSTLLLLLFAGTIFCEFFRFGKNRKNKYPQKFLPTHLALWCMYNHKLRDVCHFGTCIIILL